MPVALTQSMSLLSFSRRVVALIAASAALCSVACSNANDQPTYTATDVQLGAAPQVAQVKCQSGAVQECTIFLGQHGDLTNCVKGLDICSDGAWSGCIDDGTLSENPELYSELVGE